MLLAPQGFFIKSTDPRYKGFSKDDCRFLLSQNPSQIAEFIGIPPIAFDCSTRLCKLEIFKIVAGARFFDGDICEDWFIGKNHENGVRRKRRTLITEFMQWWENVGKAEHACRRRLQPTGRSQGCEVATESVTAKLVKCFPYLKLT